MEAIFKILFSIIGILIIVIAAIFVIQNIEFKPEKQPETTEVPETVQNTSEKEPTGSVNIETTEELEPVQQVETTEEITEEKSSESQAELETTEGPEPGTKEYYARLDYLERKKDEQEMLLYDVSKLHHSTCESVVDLWDDTVLEVNSNIDDMEARILKFKQRVARDQEIVNERKLGDDVDRLHDAQDDLSDSKQDLKDEEEDLRDEERYKEQVEFTRDEIEKHCRNIRALAKKLP